MWTGCLLACLGMRSGRAEIDRTPYPASPEIKGLQVQMVDDAIALGVHHAAVNVNLAGLLVPDPAPGQPSLTVDGRTFGFDQAYAESLDGVIKPLSDRGIVVYLILITYRSADPRIRELTIHPDADEATGTVMAADTVTAAGRSCYQALTEFIAARWSGTDSSHGRAWNWIVGNEIDSHFEWHQMGPATTEQVAEQYEEQVRLAWTSLRKHSAEARVLVSLDHHWTGRGHADPLQACSGRSLLEAFASRARARGDFDWHVAHHPYPVDLFDPRVWQDPVGFDDDTATITFRNLEVLTRALDRPELRFNGEPRRISLTEQGFNVNQDPDGELLQAAAYAYAWEKIRRLRGIDAFIYHRHVDHSLEGGLRLGLWTNKPGSIADPDRQRPIWRLFRAAGTPDWEAAARPFLETCGLATWDDVTAR